MITNVIVAIPAHNEAESIAACLASIDVAAAEVAAPIRVVVAADGCSDATVAAAESVPMLNCEVSVRQGRWGGAGAARRAAVGAGLADLSSPGGGEAASIWIANTDADTVVTPGWLHVQVRLARHYQAVAGVVDLDPARVAATLAARFSAAYRIDGERHSHVHGANLGVRADAYLRAGGWCAQTLVGEDHGLWNRLIETGAAVLHTSRARVVTSGRTFSRVEGGFATDLRALLLSSPPPARLVNLAAGVDAGSGADEEPLWSGVA
ncbi:MAG: glycosyltransferase [Acidimicrobiales bacterium]